MNWLIEDLKESVTDRWWKSIGLNDIFKVKKTFACWREEEEPPPGRFPSRGHFFVKVEPKKIKVHWLVQVTDLFVTLCQRPPHSARDVAELPQSHQVNQNWASLFSRFKRRSRLVFHLSLFNKFTENSQWGFPRCIRSLVEFIRLQIKRVSLPRSPFRGLFEIYCEWTGISLRWSLCFID